MPLAAGIRLLFLSLRDGMDNETSGAGSNLGGSLGKIPVDPFEFRYEYKSGLLPMPEGGLA
jgi:hypothetical protein